MDDTEYLQDINLRFNIEDIDHDTIGSSTFGKIYRGEDKKKIGVGVTRINESKTFLFGMNKADSVPPISIEGTIIMIEGKEDRTARKGKHSVITLSKTKPSGLINYTHGIQDTIPPSILGLKQMITPSFYFDPASRIYDATAFAGLQNYITDNIDNQIIELKNDNYGVNCSIKVSIDADKNIIFNIGIRKYVETADYEKFEIIIDKDGYAIKSANYILGNKENAEYFSSDNYTDNEGSKRVLCKLLGDLSHLIYLKKININNDPESQNKTLICTNDSYLCDRSLYNDVKGVIYRSVAKSIEKVEDRTFGGVKGPKKIKEGAVKTGKKMVEKIKVPRAPSIIKYVLYENYWGQNGGGGSEPPAKPSDYENNSNKLTDLQVNYPGVNFNDVILEQSETKFNDVILEQSETKFNDYVIGLLIDNFNDNIAGIKGSEKIDLTKSSEIENLWTHIKKMLTSIKSKGNSVNGYTKAFEHQIVFEDGELDGVLDDKLNLYYLIDVWKPRDLYELTLFMNKVIEFGFKYDETDRSVANVLEIDDIKLGEIQETILDETKFLKIILNALTNDNAELSDKFYNLLTALLFVDGYRSIDVDVIVKFINKVYDSTDENIKNGLLEFLNVIRDQDDGEQYEYIEDDEVIEENEVIKDDEARISSSVSPTKENNEGFSEPLGIENPRSSIDVTKLRLVKSTDDEKKGFFTSLPNLPNFMNRSSAAAAGGKRKTLKKRRTRRSSSKQTKNKKTRRYKKTP